jgi:hypothetical protein
MKIYLIVFNLKYSLKYPPWEDTFIGFIIDILFEI